MTKPSRLPLCYGHEHTVAAVAHRLRVKIEVEATRPVFGEATFGVPTTCSATFLEADAEQFFPLPCLRDFLKHVFPTLHSDKVEIFVSQVSFVLKDGDWHKQIRSIVREEIARRDLPEAAQ